MDIQARKKQKKEKYQTIIDTLSTLGWDHPVLHVMILAEILKETGVKY